MNLGKLLGAGKSFISGGKPAAYRTHKRVYLPQFVSPKNPFAPASAAPAQAEPPKAGQKKPDEPMKKTVTLPWAKTRKLPAAAAAGPARATTWVTRLNPASFFRPAPAAGDKGVTAIQTELSLEKVKVVHNDLSDADVEIVPLKSRPAPGSSGDDSPPPKRSWEALGERIMKATAL